MKISLYLDKTLEQNAALYFEKSKKAKKKLEGAMLAIEKSRKALEQEKKKLAEAADNTVKRPLKAAKKEWYEKFRWFISSEGFLVIGGRDATTNEMIVKKFTDKEDIVFHTYMSGSPFFVVKCADEAKKS